MKKFKLYGIVLLIAGFIFDNAYSQTHGFVQQDVINVTGVTNDQGIALLTLAQKQTTRAYTDGLGRAVQTVSVQASPAQNDIIQPIVYDNLGRQTTAYLPYAGGSTDVTGSYRTGAVSAQAAYYNNGTASKVANDAAPYSQQVFESSPLQRLLQSGVVGSGFQPGVGGSHVKTIKYRSNTGADGNIITWGPDGTNLGNYAANQLSVTDGLDEDGAETLTFTDLTGHTVLKRQVFSTTVNYDTYYVYNNAGLISYIIPPKATALIVGNSYTLIQPAVASLLYQYAYDSMGRLVQKTIPSRGIVTIIYDPLNRPLLVQDANLAANHNWYYIKYDVKGRAVSQGIYTDTGHDNTNMQSYITGNYGTTYTYETRSSTSATGYYSNNAFPATNTQPLVYAYYDDYDLNQDGIADYSYQAQGLVNEGTPTTAPIRSVPTIVRTYTVGTGLSIWLLKVMFYDKNGRPIQTQSNNQLKYIAETVTDYKTSAFDFTGAVLQTQTVKVTGTGTANTQTVKTVLAYDQVYRLQAVDQYYNGSATVNHISNYTYNEMGQLVTKNLGQIAAGTIPTNVSLSTYTTTTAIATNSIVLTPNFAVPSGSTFSAFISTGYLQTVDYRYNIRGQLLSINNSKLGNDGGVTNSDNTDLFGMQFYYDKMDINLSDWSYFNGKLAAVKWMSKDASGNSSNERAFAYTYDAANRYVSAGYEERAAGATGYFSLTHGWDETVTGYDANGNIQGLTRNATTQGSGTYTKVDNLTYTYNSTNANQLLTVTDGTGNNTGFYNLTGSTGSYAYDAKGNLNSDPYKGLNFGPYNVLNKVDKITFTYNATGRYINYSYDGSGTLIRKQQYDNNAPVTTTDYIDGFVYINGTLSYFPMPEGRVMNNGGSLTQEYIITDQQGNARLSFNSSGAGGTAKVVQENSYYGFGMVMPGSAVTGGNNKQLYNGGSEWQNDYSNLPDYYQTFNRNYDAALGRWVGTDPIAEATESLSVYQYSNNNPIMFNDPLGDLSQTQWNFVLDQAQNGIKGNYSLVDGEGGPGYTEQTDIQAFATLADKLDNGSIQGGWGATAAGSFQAAYNNFSNGRVAVVTDGSSNSVTPLSVVNIRDASWKIQAEAYQTKYYDYLRNANQGGFNNGKALDWLHSNAAASWEDQSGACAKYIRLSLEAGFGLKKDAFLGKAPVPARLYGPFLEKLGFGPVNTTNYQIGDIAVFNGIPGSKTDPKTGIPYGHIQMFDGNIWISDFKQDRPFWPSGKYQNYGPNYQIYRLGN